ncbi:19168_t:CDS:2, partial [Racocetra persica]
MVSWKYSKERLQRNPFVAKVVRVKKVICICGDTIKFNRKYDKDYINWYTNGLECKRKKQKKSEVEDVMDDDIITIDENKDEINREENANIEIINLVTNQTSRKRKLCIGLYLDLIKQYIDRTLACYNRAHHVEHVDKDCISVRAKEYTGYSKSGKIICDECLILKHNFILANHLAIPKQAPENLKFTPKFYFENNSLKKHLQNQDLLMIQAAIRKDNNKDKQNIRYNEDFTNFLVILGSFSTWALDLFHQNLEGCTIQNIHKLRTNDEDALTNLNLSFENIDKFKRPIDTLNYQDLLLLYLIIPIVIALIANNGSDNVSTITGFYQELLTQIAPQLNLSILSIGSDSAIVEFKAQVAIKIYSTDEQLTFKNDKLRVDFSCPIFLNVGSVIHIQDPKHAKKTSHNIIMSAKLCTWPSDINIATTIKYSYKLASELAKVLDMNSTSNTNNSLLLLFVMIKTPNLEILTGIKSNSEFENNSNEFFKIDKEISNAISQAFKYTTKAINDIFDLLNIKDTDDQIYQTQIISILNNLTRIFNNKQVEH